MDAATAIVCWLKNDREALARYAAGPAKNPMDSAQRRTLGARLEAAALAEQEPLDLADGSAMSIARAEATLARKEVRGPFPPLRDLWEARAVDAPAFEGQDELLATAPADAPDVDTPLAPAKDLAAAAQELAGPSVKLAQDADFSWAHDLPDEGGAFASETVRALVSRLQEHLPRAERRAQFVSAPRALAGLVLDVPDVVIVPLAPSLRVARFMRLLSGAVHALWATRLGPLHPAVVGALTLCAAEAGLEKNSAALRAVALHTALEGLLAHAVLTARADAESAEERWAIARETLGAGPGVLKRRLAKTPWPTEPPSGPAAAYADQLNGFAIFEALREQFGPRAIAAPDLFFAVREWLAEAGPIGAQPSLIKAQLAIAPESRAHVDWMFAMR